MIRSTRRSAPRFAVSATMRMPMRVVVSDSGGRADRRLQWSPLRLAETSGLLRQLDNAGHVERSPAGERVPASRGGRSVRALSTHRARPASRGDPLRYHALLAPRPRVLERLLPLRNWITRRSSRGVSSATNASSTLARTQILFRPPPERRGMQNDSRRSVTGPSRSDNPDRHEDKQRA